MARKYRGADKSLVRTGRKQARTVAYPGILFWGGVQQIQLRTEERENGDLGALDPSQEFWRQ